MRSATLRMQEQRDGLRLHGHSCSQGSTHCLIVVRGIGKKDSLLGLSVWRQLAVLTRGWGRVEKGTCDSGAPQRHWHSPWPEAGTGLGASATRGWSGKLGHSSAPRTAHGSSGKSTCSLLLSWPEGPIEQCLLQWQMGSWTAGSWEHNLTHCTPSYVLNNRNYCRQVCHGNAAFLLYRAEQPCTLRGTYRECAQK